MGGILLGLLLVADLGRANVPWVITWNWVQKYATNPVIDFLREKPYEHRVAVLAVQSRRRSSHSSASFTTLNGSSSFSSITISSRSTSS